MLEKIVSIIIAVFISYFIANGFRIGEMGWILSYIAVIITFKFIGIGEKQKK